MTPDRSRRSAVAVILLCVTLPLQWQTLAQVPGLGTLRIFHLGAIAMLLVAMPRPRTVRAVLGAVRPVPEGMIAFLICFGLCSAAWDRDLGDAVQRTVYVTLGLLGGAVLVSALSAPGGRRLLIWASPLTLVSFSLAFYQATVAARVDMLTTLERALVSGDPRVIEFSLFRASFATSDVDARSNTRHEIFAALVIVFCISLAAQAASVAGRTVVALAGILTVAYVVVSQSRSVVLAVALVALVWGTRVMVTRRIRAGTVLAAFTLLVVAAIAAPTLGGLLASRLTQTQSYDARIQAFALSSSDVLQRIATGGPKLEVSTHTLIGDAFLRGGLVAGLGACVVVIGFGRLAVRALRGLFLTGGVVHLAAVGVMSVALVRAFTSGGGQLHLTEWLGIGLVAAIIVTTGLPKALPPRHHVPAAPLARWDVYRPRESDTPDRQPVLRRQADRSRPSRSASAATPGA